MSDQPTFAFPISHDLYLSTRTYIDVIEAAPDKGRYKPLLNTIIEQATSAGLAFFLVHPLDVVGVNRLSRNATLMAVSAAERGIFAVSRRVVATLSDRQMVAVAGFLASCLVTPTPAQASAPAVDGDMSAG